jgi:FtsH-binding integral membrane protein
VSLINVFFVKSSFLDLALSVALSIVYMIYLLIDIQLVMGGKRNGLTLDNYVMGAMMIYVDIVSLFLKLLKILGKKKDD